MTSPLDPDRRSDIERLLGASLEARAGDVEPTPHLYLEVQRRTRRMRWRSVTVGTLSTATAVLATFAVVGHLSTPTRVEVADVPTVALPAPDSAAPAERTFGPSAETATDMTADPTVPGMPFAVVDADGVTLVDGSSRTELAALAGALGAAASPAVEGASSVVVVAGPSPLRFAAVSVPGSVTDPAPLTWFEERYQPRGELTPVGAQPPAPAFSSDARHLAWMERSAGAWTLRTIGGLDGPGTSSPSDDNAEWTVEFGPAVTAVLLDEWSWHDESRGTIRLLIDGDEGRTVAHLDVERHRDGALAFPVPGPVAIPGPTGIIDIAPVSDGRVWVVSASPSGEAELRLDGPDGPSLISLGHTVDPETATVETARDGAALVSDGKVWLAVSLDTFEVTALDVTGVSVVPLR